MRTVVTLNHAWFGPFQVRESATVTVTGSALPMPAPGGTSASTDVTVPAKTAVDAASAAAGDGGIAHEHARAQGGCATMVIPTIRSVTTQRRERDMRPP